MVLWIKIIVPRDAMVNRIILPIILRPSLLHGRNIDMDFRWESSLQCFSACFNVGGLILRKFKRGNWSVDALVEVPLYHQIFVPRIVRNNLDIIFTN